MSVYGVGINDVDYVTQVKETIGYTKEGKQITRLVWVCPFFGKWKGMLQRCYCDGQPEKFPSYLDCIVCGDWKYLSKFKAWMETQDWQGKELDKDLIGNGKIYSPESCCFLSKGVNLFLTSNSVNRGEWPLGVCWHKPTQKFASACNNPFTKSRVHLGTYESADEAHLVWANYKLLLAYKLIDEIGNESASNALISKYTEIKIAAEESVAKAKEALKAAENALKVVKEGK